MPTPNLENVSAGFAIDAVEAVVITTESKSYLVKTSNEVGFQAVVDAGEEKTLRKLNQILATSKTEDLPKGFDVTLSDVLFTPELYAIMNGGTATMASAAFSSYAGPALGAPVTYPAFSLDVYSRCVGTGGESVSWLKFSVTYCTGKPTDFTLRDGEFFSPKYEIKSRPVTGQPPMEIEKVAALPAVAGA